MRTYTNFINGRFVPNAGDLIDVINPSTGALVSQVPETPPSQVSEAIAAAETAQKQWRKLAPIERATELRKVAAAIRSERDHLAHVTSEEQGKTLELATGEVNSTADFIDYNAEWARRIEGEIIASDRRNENIFLFRHPIGVIAGILPWNFPFFLVARKMAPALVTGNTIVIKPSEETPNNAFEFARIVEACGLPAGVFNVVSGHGASVGNQLASDPRIGMVSFTGSVGTGSKVMTAAAANITKVNLELGGKAPALVLADADLDLAAEAIKNSRVLNSGQVCNCAERVYVDRRVADAFTEKLTAVMKRQKFGNPLLESGLDYGPMINAAGLAKVERLVGSAVQAGASVVTGGNRVERGGGLYYEPTVISGCRQDMQIIREEVFGPVVPIVTFEDLDQAIAFANDCDYGLTSSIYTTNINVAMRACNEINFGETYINRENFEAIQGFHAGWRKSGIGGTDGKHGLYEFMQTQTVYIQYDDKV